MPLKDLEELAFAVQIDYTPPLREDERQDVIRELTWLLEHKDEINEEDIMKDRKRRRKREGKMCDQVNTIDTGENLLLMSDQQLIFFPFTTSSGEKRYYCFTRYEVEEYILKQKINPYTNSRFSDEELELLKDMLHKEPYPIIYIGGLLSEIEDRLSGQSLKYKVMEYRQLADEWANIVESVLPGFKTGTILDFATELENRDYLLFLTDSYFTRTIDPNLSRNDAATETMRIILDAYNSAKSAGESSAKLLVTRLALAMDEFLYMIRGDLNYFDLLDTTEFELYWKPGNLREDFYDNGAIAQRYFVDKDGHINGMYIEYSQNGIKTKIHNYLGGEQVGLQKTFYPNGQLFESYTNDDQGRKGGVQLKYYKSGKPMSAITYVKGKEEGPSEVYYANGNLAKNINYSNGLLDGYYETFHNNGYPQERGIYKKGQKEGTFEEYDKYGRLIKTVNYVKGLRY
jgi:antitoxin component YwqK of YwqJK toxin-antitoxin module